MSAGLLVGITLAAVVAALLRTGLSVRRIQVRAAGRRIRSSDKLLLVALGSFLTVPPLVLAAPQAALVMVPVGVGSVLALFDPVLAVSFLLSLLVIRPWEIYPDTAVLLYVPRAVALVAVASFGLWAAARQERPLRTNTFLGLFLMYLGWICLASLFSDTPAASLDYIVTTFIPIGVVMFLVVNCFREPEDLRILRLVLLISISGTILTALWFTLLSGEAPAGERLRGIGLWGNANDLAALITIAFPLAIFSGARESAARRGFLPAVGRLGACLIFLLGLWYSQSRGGFYAVGLATGAYVGLCRASLMTKALAACVGMVLVVLLLFGVSRERAEMESSSTARWNYAITAFRMARSSPLFGVGVNNFPRLYESFTPGYEETGTRAAHSSWLLALAESGVIGLGLFVGLMGWAARWAWRLRTVRPDLFTVFLGYACAMSFLSHTYTILPYLVCGLVLLGARTEFGAEVPSGVYGGVEEGERCRA